MNFARMVDLWNSSITSRRLPNLLRWTQKLAVVWSHTFAITK